SLLLVDRGEDGIVPLDHRRNARPHSDLFDVIQVGKNFLDRPLACRRTRLHLRRYVERLYAAPQGAAATLNQLPVAFLAASKLVGTRAPIRGRSSAVS